LSPKRNYRIVEASSHGQRIGEIPGRLQESERLIPKNKFSKSHS
jgi:hypothetical protein